MAGMHRDKTQPQHHARDSLRDPDNGPQLRVQWTQACMDEIRQRHGEGEYEWECAAGAVDEAAPLCDDAGASCAA